MESGNVEVGFLNWTVANNFAYATGYPLGPVETSGREILQQLQLYNADSVLPIFQQVRLPITYFMGLEERVINWEELGAFDALLSSKSDTYRSSFGYLARLELALFFGELELAERMSNALQPYMAHEAQYAIIVKFIFYSGLTYSGLARKGGKLERKYRSKAASWSHKMAKICRTKGRNPLHKCFIMKADLLACHCKDAEKIARAYDEGISAAVKLGYVQDAALGSELAGEFFLAMNESDRARQYICRACDLYQEVSDKFMEVFLIWAIF